eukprot:TRINITY_DN12112_c0_g1_i2.p1 TRINITY_DN12112_c0_g1~~TRINITY_DN12112_c0_g1_i2.p1  ORF type:complete len:365 (+),score=59.73 TRINITY_DN12112_c0_g1_i2:89-1183(+)
MEVDPIELWSVLEVVLDGEGPVRNLPEKERRAQLNYDNNPNLKKCLEVLDPVLGDIPGACDRTAYAFLELNKRFQILESLPGQEDQNNSPTLYFTDIDGAPGGWTEGICYLAFAGMCAKFEKIQGIGISQHPWELQSSKCGKCLPKSFYYLGADQSGNATHLLNIRAMVGKVQFMTSGRGQQLLLGATHNERYNPIMNKSVLLSRLLLTILTVARGGAAIIHIPFMESTFSSCVLYILRHMFQQVHITQPRVMPPTRVASCYAVCMNKLEAPLFDGPMSQRDPLTSFLYRLLPAVAVNDIYSFMEPEALDEKSFKAWLTAATAPILQARMSLLSRVSEIDITNSTTDPSVLHYYFESLGCLVGN